VLGVFFGIGALGLPLVLGLLMKSLGYTMMLAGTGALVTLVLIYYLSIRFPAPKHPHGFPLRDAARLIRDPVVLLLGLILFFESGVEITRCVGFSRSAAATLSASLR
jgi:hypothetical protein